MKGRPRFYITAAVPSKDLLSVVTLSWNGSHLYMVPSATSFFELRSDDQVGVCLLGKELFQFFGQLGVSGILIRRGPSAGPHAASPGSWKIETLLQLLPLTCVELHVQKLTSWLRQQDWLLPKTQIGLRGQFRKVQERAIQTAAFGVAEVLTRLSSPNILKYDQQSLSSGIAISG